ncbi:unnamed protein product [Rotaria sp. Silwood1]|nr:unnamed protein product [Rotaria sp. Silwood1]
MRTSATRNFRRLLSLIRSSTHSNRLQPALQTTVTNILFFESDNSVIVGQTGGSYYDEDDQQCSCSNEPNCTLPSGFFNSLPNSQPGLFSVRDHPIANVTGFLVGCYAIESLFGSTLECFFDSECLQTVLRFFPSTSSLLIHALSIDTQTHFSPQTSIEKLVTELFIEDLSSTISYAAYLARCAPTSCTFTYQRHNNFVYLLTTLLGLYGGLTIALRLFVPALVSWWRMRKLESNEEVNDTERLRKAFRWVRIQLYTMNLFKDASTRSNFFDMMTQLIATRIYFILLCLSVITLVIYGASNIEIKTVIIKSPSLAVHENLYAKYSSTLFCPCSRIAIEHNKFISLSPRFHRVCSSAFIGDDWIKSTQGSFYGGGFTNFQDFRVAAPAFFATLASFCSLSQTIVSDAWQVFNQSILVTSQAVSENELLTRIEAILNQFKVDTVGQSKRALRLIDIHAQSVFSTARTNADLLRNPYITLEPMKYLFNSIPQQLGNCSCALVDNCQNTVGFYNYTSNDTSYSIELNFNVPKFFIGCSIIEGVRQSSLECFFNQTCLDVVQSNLNSEQSINISILENNATRFQPQTIIANIIDALMIEQWRENINYSQYYAYCEPKLCSYTIPLRNNALYVLTTLLALVGGLSAALRFLVPTIVKFIRNRLQQETNRNMIAG